MYCRGWVGSSVTVIGGDKDESLAKIMIAIVAKKSITVMGRFMTINFATRKMMIMTAESQGSSL